ncbi:unnamed protein product [Closterium sp. Naga37s-1]|nr:unnamed protein product [Closterium sp. Naga37s-1]
MSTDGDRNFKFPAGSPNLGDSTDNPGTRSNSNDNDGATPSSNNDGTPAAAGPAAWEGRDAPGMAAVVGSDGLRKGPWTAGEDDLLWQHVRQYGEGNWNLVQQHTGLARCGKSCRLRWANQLRPNLKKGGITAEEERTIVRLQQQYGNKWARIASHVRGMMDWD